MTDDTEDYVPKAVAEDATVAAKAEKKIDDLETAATQMMVLVFLEDSATNEVDYLENAARTSFHLDFPVEK